MVALGVKASQRTIVTVWARNAPETVKEVALFLPHLLLNLPEYTYPVLGLAIGKPDQDPDVKPRMPRTMQFFEPAP